MKRRLLEGFGIAAVSVLLVGLLELGLRTTVRLQSGTWPSTRLEEFDRRIRTTFGLYRPHAYLNTAPGEGRSASAFGKQASFNSLGYRSPERPLEKPANTSRWLFLGGSTTFDLLAENDQATWPWRLEDSLAQRACDIESWNAGFPGWTSVENAIGLIVRDLDLKPDVIVLFQGINDLQPAASRPFDRQYENHAADARRALGFNLPPLRWSDRSFLLEKLRDVVLGPQDPWSLVGPDSIEGRRQRIEPDALRVFKRNVKAVLSLAQGREAKIVLVTQVVRLRAQHLEADRRYLGGWVPGLEPDSIASELERLNDITRSLASEDAEAPVIVLDAARDIAWRDEDFGDAMHFSAAGSARFADYLRDRLSEVLEDKACGRFDANSPR